jgi:hypothetical protein
MKKPWSAGEWRSGLVYQSDVVRSGIEEIQRVTADDIRDDAFMIDVNRGEVLSPRDEGVQGGYWERDVVEGQLG